MKKKLLTGLQPSGDLHIGNYFGALKPFIDAHGEYDSFIMVADYHALTSKSDREALTQNIYNVVRSYLAIGINPNKVVLFKQSDVPEHTELAWIFNCLVTVPFLMNGHAYKDKVAKGLEPNAGLFTYPMLQAADILLYDTEVVPVGEDQRQHIEYAREAANKFNNAYSETFKEPKELILKSVGVVPGTDGQKMSKSYGNTIPLFGSKDEIAKAVMRITAGPGMTREEAIALSKERGGAVMRDAIGPVRNLLLIHQLFNSDPALIDLYLENSENYKVLKEKLIEDIEKYIGPMRDRYNKISDSEVKKVLKKGGERARKVAAKKMAEVREKIGVALY